MSEKENVAVYPGSFDPPTYGHMDLMRRGAKIFDRLIVAVARNNAKQSLFTAEERVEMLRAITEEMPRVEVTSFHGLTVEFAREHGAIAIVRGLRAISDFEYEHTIAVTNQKMNPDVDTVCLMPSEAYLFLSSRIVKEIASFGGDTSLFVPDLVAEKLREKMQTG